MLFLSWWRQAFCESKNQIIEPLRLVNKEGMARCFKNFELSPWAILFQVLRLLFKLRRNDIEERLSKTLHDALPVRAFEGVRQERETVFQRHSLCP